MRGERGVALLETLVALTILAAAGVSLAALAAAGARAEAAARLEERATVAANRLLTALSLLNRDELDQRIGAHPVGEFSVEIQRPEPGLYRLAVGLASEPGGAKLVTVVYRVEPGVVRREE